MQQKNSNKNKLWYFMWGGMTLCLLIIFILPFCLTSCTVSFIDMMSKNMSNYNIKAEFLENSKTVIGQMEIDYVNDTNNELNEIVFNLYPNGFSETSPNVANMTKYDKSPYPNGISYGGIDIKVASENSNTFSPHKSAAENIDLSYEKSQNENLTQSNYEYVMRLKTPLGVGDRRKIYVEFETQIPNIKHRLGYVDDIVNLGNWYPQVAVKHGERFQTNPYYSVGDPFFSQTCNYDVEIVVPSSYEVATSGEAVFEENEASATKKVISKMRACRDFAVVLSKSMKYISRNINGVELKYYYVNDSSPQTALNYATKAMQTFSAMYGEYPYKTLSVVETFFLHGGMEYSGLVYVSNELESQFYNEVIVHEIAHQWWYGVVGNNQVVDAWIDEGLAEFSTAMFYDKNKSFQFETNHMQEGQLENKDLQYFVENSNKSYKEYLKFASNLGIKADTVMQKHLKDFTGEIQYVSVVYEKGFLLFENIYTSVGEKKFINAMKKLYNNNRFKIVTKEHIAGIFEDKNIGLIIDSWINGNVCG